jgi:GNAT superfamily N-acetyltransferase
MVEPLRTAAELGAVRPLWDALYRHLGEVAGRPMAAPDGFDRWIGAYDRVAGRTRQVFADRDGFVEALVRAAPAWAPPALTGFVGQLYVLPAARGGGLAAALLGAAEEWCRSRGVDQVELQVMAGNAVAERFWRRQGYLTDLHQMRKQL